MGIASLVLALAGIAVTMLHYVDHSVVFGVVAIVLLLSASALGIFGMKRQRKNGGLRASMANPALMGHASAAVTFVVCGIMCIIANFVGK